MDGLMRRSRARAVKDSMLSTTPASKHTIANLSYGLLNLYQLGTVGSLNPSKLYIPASTVNFKARHLLPTRLWLLQRLSCITKTPQVLRLRSKVLDLELTKSLADKLRNEHNCSEYHSQEIVLPLWILCLPDYRRLIISFVQRLCM